MERDGVYRVLNSTTLWTRFPSFENNNNNNNNNGRSARSARSGEAGAGRRHAFTRIFGSESSQAETFERSIKHRVADLLGGESSTIMTYGTRDSGKTYTLLGTPASPGIIPRSIELVFSAINCTLTPWYKPTCRDTVVSLDETAQAVEARRNARVLGPTSRVALAEARRSLENSKQTKKLHEEPDGDVSMHAVWLSLAEIYNGNVYDLLDDRRTPLGLTADNEGRTYVCSLQRVYAISALEACRIVAAGRSRLSTAAATPSDPNACSRSHTIFTLKLLRYRKARATDEVVVSTLTFCDLAGSTQFETRRKRLHMREASNINNSLLVLGRCLKAVGSRNRMAPFRESKLTRICQRALTGRESLTLIVNVAFTPNLYVETQNTLFGFCAIARKLLAESRGDCEISRRANSPADRELEEGARSPDSDDTAPSSVRRTPSEVAETIGDYVDSVAYEDVQEQNRRLMKELAATKSDVVQREYAIRRELADHYSRMIEELEATYKRHTEEIETERDDLLTWSVKQIEGFYKERVDSLMRRKKRKRGDSGDYVEDNRALYEDLEAENARIAAKMATLREAATRLRKENRTILCERNRCGFELALTTEELRKFRELTRAGIRKWGGDDKPIGDSADCLVSNLERLMDERMRRAEEKLQELNVHVRVTEDGDAEAAATTTKQQEPPRSGSLSDETSSTKTRELEEQLLHKEARIAALNGRVQLRERQLAEVQRRLNDAESGGNANSRGCKCDRSTNISLDDYMADGFFDNTAERDSSSTADQQRVLDHNHWIGPKRETLSNTSNVDRSGLLEISGSVDCSVSSDTSSKNDSGISGGSRDGGKDRRSLATTSEREDKCTQTRLSEVQRDCITKEGMSDVDEQLRITDREDSKRQARKGKASRVTEFHREPETIGDDAIDASDEAGGCANEREIAEERASTVAGEKGEIVAIERDNLSLLSKTNRGLTVQEESENRTSRCLERYLERYRSFEEQLSSIRDQLDRLSSKCANIHARSPRVVDDNFKETGLRKTLRTNELDRRIAQMQQNLAIGFELFEKVNDFEIIVNRWQRDRNEFYRQLYVCSETQLTLEDKLRKLTVKAAESKSVTTWLESDICELTDLNAANHEKTRNLIERVNVAGESAATADERADSRCCEDLRKNVKNIMKQEIDSFRSWFTDYKDNTVFLNKISRAYDNSQDEVTRLNVQLRDKEREIALLKSNVDVATRNYETLKGYLPNEIEARNKQFKTVRPNDFEGSFIERSELCEVLDSLKTFGSAGNNRGQPEALLRMHQGKCSLTNSICLVPKHVSSEALNTSSALSENSTTSSDEKDGAVLKFDDIESRQVRLNVIQNYI